MRFLWVIVALSGWVTAVAAMVSSSRNRRARVLAELRPVANETPAPLPVDAILDSLPLGVVVVDTDGRERFRNAAVRDSSIARHEAVLIDAVIERLSRLAVGGESTTEQMELVGPPLRVLVVNAIPSTSTGAVVTI